MMIITLIFNVGEHEIKLQFFFLCQLGMKIRHCPIDNPVDISDSNLSGRDRAKHATACECRYFRRM